MAPFDRLCEWIDGLLGTTGADTGPTGDDPSRLDPDNVTEVRTEVDDDPVEELRDVRRWRPASEREDDPPDRAGDGHPKG